MFLLLGFHCFCYYYFVTFANVYGIAFGTFHKCFYYFLCVFCVGVGSPRMNEKCKTLHVVVVVFFLSLPAHDNRESYVHYFNTQLVFAYLA